jgi:hypothetical protein
MTYKEILEDLGYTLQDCGSHWRSNAVYRSGKNKTALIIYKDTGVWKDFGADHLAHKNIEESGEVILVESIGDCMALYEAGFKNVLMLAGLDISSKVMSYLNSFNLDKIIVSMNNDKHKETNSGGIATIKTVAKLSQIYDLDQICINPPLANDFGDMLESNPSNIDIFSKWNERKCKWNLADEKTQEWIKDQIKLACYPFRYFHFICYDYCSLLFRKNLGHLWKLNYQRAV